MLFRVIQCDVTGGTSWHGCLIDAEFEMPSLLLSAPEGYSDSICIFLTPTINGIFCSAMWRIHWDQKAFTLTAISAFRKISYPWDRNLHRKFSRSTEE
jgi:hypothetical protein